MVTGVPPGLGSYVHWDRRIDGRLAQSLMSIPGVKGVEFGLGFAQANFPGSRVHDPIVPADDSSDKEGRLPLRFVRSTNNAGGIEGGMSNGETIICRAAMKPLSTLMSPLPSINLRTGAVARAHLERSDVCVVPAAGIVGEAMVAWELARVVLEQFGGDTMSSLLARWNDYREQVCAYGR